MKYKAILFDKDGTLIDFHDTWMPVYRIAALTFANDDEALADELLGAHGYDHNNRRFIGGSLLAAGNNREITLAWCEQLNRQLSDQQFEDQHQSLSQIFQHQGAKSAVAVPELNATIEQLKNRGLKLGVATSDSYAGIHNTLQSFDVLSQFDFLCGYDSGHGVKPEAGMVNAFCKQAEISAEQTIVVGDNKHDIEMGRNAGAGLCVGVLTGTSNRDELEAIADYVFDDIGGLLTLFADNG